MQRQHSALGAKGFFNILKFGIVPLLMQHYMLLQRNLLYTAVTRGKRLVVLVGNERAIRKAVGEAEAAERHTGLGARLQALDDKIGRS